MTTSDTGREPGNVTIHLDLDRPDELAACGYYLGRNGGEDWATDASKVTCAECRPVAASAASDNVTPEREVHFEDGAASWEAETLPCGYPFNVVRYGETTSDPAKVTCTGCIETLDDEVPVDERSCWPICDACADGRKEDCERLAAEREPDHVTPCWSCKGSSTLTRIDGAGELETFDCTVCAAPAGQACTFMVDVPGKDWQDYCGQPGRMVMTTEGRYFRCATHEPVWVSVERSGIDYHDPTGENGTTVCGRSMRTGVQLAIGDATSRLVAKRCERCYPAPTVRCCDPGPFCDDSPGCELDGLSSQVELDLQIAAEREPSNVTSEACAVHGGRSHRACLAYPALCTPDPAAPAEVPVCLAASRHGGICGQPAPCDGSRHTEPEPASTERRTVSLGVLTGKRLREAAALLQQANTLIEAVYEETPRATSQRVALSSASHDIDTALSQVSYVAESPAVES